MPGTVTALRNSGVFDHFRCRWRALNLAPGQVCGLVSPGQEVGSHRWPCWVSRIPSSWLLLDQPSSLWKLCPETRTVGIAEPGGLGVPDQVNSTHAAPLGTNILSSLTPGPWPRQIQYSETAPEVCSQQRLLLDRGPSTPSTPSFCALCR